MEFNWILSCTPQFRSLIHGYLKIDSILYIFSSSLHLLFLLFLLRFLLVLLISVFQVAIFDFHFAHFLSLTIFFFICLFSRLYFNYNTSPFLMLPWYITERRQKYCQSYRVWDKAMSLFLLSNTRAITVKSHQHDHANER